MTIKCLIKAVKEQGGLRDTNWVVIWPSSVYSETFPKPEKYERSVDVSPL